MGLSCWSITLGPYLVSHPPVPSLHCYGYTYRALLAVPHAPSVLPKLSCRQELLDGIQRAAVTAQVELLGHVTACVRGL